MTSNFAHDCVGSYVDDVSISGKIKALAVKSVFLKRDGSEVGTLFRWNGGDEFIVWASGRQNEDIDKTELVFKRL